MKIKNLTPLLAGLALLCACKGKGGSAADSTSVVRHQTYKEKAATADTVQMSKLVKTADLQFKVKNVRQTSEQVASLTTSLNGSVIRQLISSRIEKEETIHVSNDSLMRVTLIATEAETTVKVPPARMEEFVNGVSKMGIYIDSLKMNIKDRSLAYLSTRLKLKNKQEQIKESNAKSPEAVLNLKNEAVDKQIANLATADSAKNSTISLRFYENNTINRELIANDDFSAYNPSFAKRLSMAISGGWNAFEQLVLGLAYLWVLIPVAIGCWWIYKHYKTKKPAPITKID